MYEREMPCEANLLSAFALMIGGALGTGLPMALLIIWLCSWTLLARQNSRDNWVDQNGSQRAPRLSSPATGLTVPPTLLTQADELIE